MVATDLLANAAASSSPFGAKMLNRLAEEPRTVARWLVARMRGVKGNGAYFKCFTLLPSSLTSARCIVSSSCNRPLSA